METLQLSFQASTILSKKVAYKTPTDLFSLEGAEKRHTLGDGKKHCLVSCGNRVCSFG